MPTKSLPFRCHSLLMPRHLFFKLAWNLKAKNTWKDLWYLSVRRNVSTSDRVQLLEFSHSRCFPTFHETVTSHFQIVLQAFVAVVKEMIKPPSSNDMPLEILTNMICNPSFKYCIYVISGHRFWRLLLRQSHSI